MKSLSYQEATASHEEAMLLPASADWDGQIRSIYHAHLAPLFAACHCPFYGIERAESWNDPDEPEIRWWQVTVVLGVLTDGGWELRGREYLFRAEEGASPQLTTMGPEYSWPATPAQIQ